MPKSKKAKPVGLKDRQRSEEIRRYVMNWIGAICMVAILGSCYVIIRRYVTREVIVQQGPPQVVLKNRPPWMSDALAVQIVNSIRPWGTYSVFDRSLLEVTAEILKKNAWIKDVKEIRRAYTRSPGDTLEIDCDYRAPIALVHWSNYFWLVDGDGVKLPEQFTQAQLPSIVMGQDRRLNMRIIEGVHTAPVHAGQKWPGDDLTAGLDLAKVLYGLNYAEEIVKVDVANFAGRIDPKEAQITLITKYDTQIRWGRPINSRDFFVEIPTSQKLRVMEQIYADYHRVDGGQPWVDIRFDLPTYPKEATARVDISR